MSAPGCLRAHYAVARAYACQGSTTRYGWHEEIAERVKHGRGAWSMTCNACDGRHAALMNRRVAACRFGSMERPTKFARLTELTRLRQHLPFVSQSALAAILKHAADHELPECSGPKQIRTARSEFVKQMTPYGPLHQKMRVGASQIEVQHPLAVLYYTASKSVAFTKLLRRAVEENPCSAARPWRVVLYFDEIFPGNQLAYKNTRKMWASYWTLLELGSAALSSEDSARCGASDVCMPCICARVSLIA